jgi:hypothetical protein
MSKDTLTFEQAEKCLPDGDDIHTFSNPGAGMMIGFDWPRQELLKAMRESTAILVAGETAKGIGHGLVIEVDGRWLFIETAKTDEVLEILA